MILVHVSDNMSKRLCEKVQFYKIEDTAEWCVIDNSWKINKNTSCL